MLPREQANYQAIQRHFPQAWIIMLQDPRPLVNLGDWLGIFSPKEATFPKSCSESPTITSRPW
jgi:hypothetical protein